MERVAFLVDETGERIDCLLNPESVAITRLAGVRARGTASGQLTGTGLADDPLQFTGGGRTELTLDLLFDVDFVEEQLRPADVRALTRRLWMLAENSAEQLGSFRPPLVWLVWCKSWNLPCVITAIAERYDAFGTDGTPRRSWLRMKLVRVAETAAEAELTYNDELQRAAAQASAARSESVVAGETDAVRAIGEGGAEPDFSGVRFDLLATDAVGNPFLWRRLAQHNGIDNPFDVQAGAVLAVPPELTSPQAAAPNGAGR
jgi:nucleoid-associated protein YgaU